MTDHRRWPRMALALDVQVRLENREGAIEAQLLNISREGLFIGMDPPRPIGTRVRVAIHVASTEDDFIVEGVVIRAVAADESPAGVPGVGVFLTSSSDGWTRFCDELAIHRAAAELDDGPTDQIPSSVVEAVRRPK